MKKVAIVAVLLLGMVVFINDVEAQCAMCKATAEQGDQTGLNLGILYLFLAPYLIVGTIGFFWWKNRKKEPSQNDKFINLGDIKSN